MVKSRKAADADKRTAGRRRGGEDDSYSFDDGGASESGEEAAATAPDLSMDALRKVFHLPCVDAAAALGVAHSKLKRRCHKLKISRWPQRKLASLVFLRDALPNDPRMSASQREGIIAKIDSEYSRVMQDPNHPLDKELEQLRKSNYKLNYNRKLKCGAKAGKRAGSVGDTDIGAAVDAGDWGGSSRAGATGDGDGGGGGARRAAAGGRGARGMPPALTLGRGNATSPTGSGQENGSGEGGDAAAASGAADSPVWDTAAEDDVVAAAAAVAGFGNSPRKVVQRRLAAQLGGAGGAAAGGGGGAGLGRRSSLERATLLSVISDGKIMKQGGAPRRQSGSGSGNATPRQLAGGGPVGSLGGGGGGGGPGSPHLRRSLASPVGHGGGAATNPGKEGLLEALWASQNPHTAEQPPSLEQLQLQQQQQQLLLQQQQLQLQLQLQLPLQRPGAGGFAGADEDWRNNASPRGAPLTHGSQHPAHLLPDAAAAGYGGAGGGGGVSNVVSAGVNAILADTSVDGLLLGLEAMVAAGVGGSGGGRRSLGAEQLSEEELALLGIQGADRDLLLDPTTDPGLDPLLDLLLMGDALTGGGAGGGSAGPEGLGRQMARQQPSLMPHGMHAAGTAAMQQLQQQHLVNLHIGPQQQQQQQHRLSASFVGTHSHSHSHAQLHQHQHQHQQLPLVSAGFGGSRRLSDALPGAGDGGGLLGDFGPVGAGGGGGVAVGVSSLLRASASGLPMSSFGGGFGGGALGGLGGGGGVHSAPLRQHRLSSVSGLASGAGQRPSRFAGGLDMPSSTSQPLDFATHLGLIGGGGLPGPIPYDDRYGAGLDAAGPGFPGLGSDLGRRRGPPTQTSLNHPQQSLQQPNPHLNHSHPHVVSPMDGRHSAPGQIGIPGWDEAPRLVQGGHGGGLAGPGGADLGSLTRRVLQSSTGVPEPVADLGALVSGGGAAAADPSAAQRLATALGSGDLPGDARLGGGGDGRRKERALAGGGGGGWGRLQMGNGELGDGAAVSGSRGAHGRSSSASGLADHVGDNAAGGGAAAAGVRPSTASGLDGAAASLSLHGRREQLTAREQLIRSLQGNSGGSGGGGYGSSGSGGYGSGGGGPAVAAAALGAPVLHSQQQQQVQTPALLPSPTDPPSGRGSGAATGVYSTGHVSPPPDTIASLQGLQLRGEDDRIAAALDALQQPLLASAAGGVGAAGGTDLAAMLQELQYFRRQQQLQIIAQQQQIAAQQLQIARLGALSGISNRYDDLCGSGPAGKQQQQPAAAAAAALQGHPVPRDPADGAGSGVSAAVAAAAARQQLQRQRYEGGSGVIPSNGVGAGAAAAAVGGGGGGQPGTGAALLEALDFHLTDIGVDALMERNMDFLRRNGSGFGSFINEMRGAGAGVGVGAGAAASGGGGSFSLGGGAAAGGADAGGGGMDVELMRQNLRRGLRQNSAEQWEEMLRHLAGNSGSL